MISQSALNNLYKVYEAATAEFRAIGQAGWAEALHEDFGHELSAVDSWYDEGARGDERPYYSPSMADLNYYLRKRGYKGVGGKTPRVVTIHVDCVDCGEELGSEWATVLCHA
jgi:hypothetical protein